MRNAALAYAESQRDAFLTQLFDFLRIPSVSTQPAHRPDIERAARWLADHMRAIGLTRAEVLPTTGHPVVYGEWLEAGPQAETILIYGHYDVQPPDPLDQWLSPPFEPQVRDDNLYARGAADDKGQLFIHLKAVESYLKGAGRLPVNVKFILEGEEESGSGGLEAFVRAERDRLQATAILVSDSPMPSPQQPALLYALRGLTYMEVTVQGPDHDLHSGSYGGAVRNPAEALCGVLARLKDEEGHITIPGFYDRVRPLEAEEREALARLPFTEARFLQETGVPAPWGEAGYTVLEQITARPTLEINGLVSGYTGPGSKTIIPATAAAKVSMRLVPDQDPEEIARLFTEHVARLMPPQVRATIETRHTAWPVLIDRHAPAMEAAARALEAVFGAPPVYTREGGTIPIVATFQRQLGAPVVLMGFGLPDDNLHAPNEKFHLPNFYRGIAASIHFLAEMGALRTG